MIDASCVGLGCKDYRLAVYIGNRPILPEFQSLEHLKPLALGEVAFIVDSTGNHWRKIFNIYAKLMYQLEVNDEASWQNYRDNCLLQQGCGHALIFSNIPSVFPISPFSAIRIISGKSYAQTLGVLDETHCIEDGFYIDIPRKIIVTPYFDYRQLSNRKLDMLISIIQCHFK